MDKDKKSKKDSKRNKKKIIFVEFISFEKTNPFQDRLELKKK